MRFFSNTDAAVWTIDEDRSRVRVNQPAQPRAVGEVFAHFGVEFVECIAWGTQFDDEIGTQGREAVEVGRGQRRQPLVGYPSGVWGSDSAIGEFEAGRGIHGDASSILLRPVAKLA
ncbi:MAG: hypothetical protein NZ585_12770 [Chloracidobacterium sp.]|nr:hypothetical protein [Chloracidobacterium sp.]